MDRTQVNRDEEIRQLAYRLWQEEGCPDGREVEHWAESPDDLGRNPLSTKQADTVQGF